MKLVIKLKRRTRAEAKAQGLKRYFTGVPCPQGHVVERYVSSSACRACIRLKMIAKRRDPSSKIYASYRDKLRTGLRRRAVIRLGNECECCGEQHKEFLTLDHINGDGAVHRKEMGGGSGLAQYRIFAWAVKAPLEEVKAKVRVLCFNCNLAIGFWGYCPHRMTSEHV
jgi:hypothetical protein